MISWIPEEIAKIGNVVRLKEMNSSEWSKGWSVVAVYERRSYEQLVVEERDWCIQREASDV